MGELRAICKLIWPGDERRHLYDETGLSIDVDNTCGSSFLCSLCSVSEVFRGSGKETT